MIGTLGDVVFRVSEGYILTPKNISGTAGSQWAKHEVVHDVPRAEWIGRNARSYKFDILLRAQDGVPPRSTLDKLRTMAESPNAYWFVIGGQPMAENPFVLKSMSEEWGAVMHGGKLAECSVSLELEEYR